jgi:hypothetical protein
MSLSFVSRAEQIDHLRCAVTSGATGPVVITGEPGIGRTTVLTCALNCADSGRDEIIWLRASRDRPFATLSGSWLTSLPAGSSIENATAMMGRADGRRLVVAADDAHLMDYSSLLALSGLMRRGGALLLATRPLGSARMGHPDLSDCLTYEKGIQLITLLPLSVSDIAAVLARIPGQAVPSSAAEAVQAATGGNPRQLHELIARASPAGPPPADQAFPGAARLAAAAWDAWRRLAIERAEQLTQLALRCGIREEIGPVRAMLLLLRGRTGECVAFLESLGAVPDASGELAVAHAMALALGLDQPRTAGEFLLAAARRDRAAAEFLLAFRAWLLAIAGLEAQAASGLAGLSRSDRRAALFIHAANALLARLSDHRAETVFHFRRALATAETCCDGFPWMRPYLQASLIDALLLAGRVKEAVSAAQRFHAREPAAGWAIAVSLDTLIAKCPSGPRYPVMGDREKESAAWPD